jgi:hypothetical protein
LADIEEFVNEEGWAMQDFFGDVVIFSGMGLSLFIFEEIAREAIWTTMMLEPG